MYRRCCGGQQLVAHRRLSCCPLRQHALATHGFRPLPAGAEYGPAAGYATLASTSSCSCGGGSCCSVQHSQSSGAVTVISTECSSQYSQHALLPVAAVRAGAEQSGGGAESGTVRQHQELEYCRVAPESQAARRLNVVHLVSTSTTLQSVCRY